MRRHGNRSSLVVNLSSEPPSLASSTAITASHTSDLSVARIETFLDSPIRPDVPSPPGHAHLEGGDTLTSPTAIDRIRSGIPVAVSSTSNAVTTGVATGLVAGFGIVSDVAKKYTPDFSELEEHRTDTDASAAVPAMNPEQSIVPGISSTCTPENDRPAPSIREERSTVLSPETVLVIDLKQRTMRAAPPTTTTENDRPVPERQPSAAIENKKNETSMSEMSIPTAEFTAELYSRLRAAGLTLDSKNRRSAHLREEAGKITPRVILAAPSPEPGQWTEEERILVWSRSGSPLLETEDLPEESVPVEDVATPSNQDSVLKSLSKNVDKGNGKTEVVHFDHLPASEEIMSLWNAPTEPYDPWSKRQSAFVQASSKANGKEKVVTFDPDPVSAKIPSPWSAPTALYTSSSEEDYAVEHSFAVVGKGKGKAMVEFSDPVVTEGVSSPYSTPTEAYASSSRQDAAVVNASSMVNERKQKEAIEKEEGAVIAGIEKWKRKVQHPLSNKPDLVSYKYETKSSRVRKVPHKKTSVGTPVTMRKDIRKELADMEAKEARLIAASFSFTSGQNSSNGGREQKGNGKNAKRGDVPKTVVPTKRRKGKEKAAEEPITPATSSDIHGRQSTIDFTQNTARSRAPRTSGRARQEKGRSSAWEPVARSTRTSTFDAPTASSLSRIPKHSTRILKRPAKETSLSEPPTIASAQDISDSTRKANSSLRPDDTTLLPSAQQSHTPVSSPSRAGPASHTPRSTPRPRPAWGARGSPSTPLNGTVHNGPRRSSKAARTPSRAMENKLDEAIDKHIENGKCKGESLSSRK
jgi:hypothetical protein